MKYYHCSSCIYCTTNDFMTGYCSYWGKMVFMTDGCSLDEDDDNDIFDDLDDDF